MHSPVYVAAAEDLHLNIGFMACSAKIPAEVLMQFAWLITLVAFVDHASALICSYRGTFANRFDTFLKHRRNLSFR